MNKLEEDRCEWRIEGTKRVLKRMKCPHCDEWCEWDFMQTASNFDRPTYVCYKCKKSYTITMEEGD